jgi:hypothetical protein
MQMRQWMAEDVTGSGKVRAEGRGLGNVGGAHGQISAVLEGDSYESPTPLPYPPWMLAPMMVR